MTSSFFYMEQKCILIALNISLLFRQLRLKTYCYLNLFYICIIYFKIIKNKYQYYLMKSLRFFLYDSHA